MHGYRTPREDNSDGHGTSYRRGRSIPTRTHGEGVLERTNCRRDSMFKRRSVPQRLRHLAESQSYQTLGLPV